MKRVLFAAALMMAAFSTSAQNADSVNLVTAPRVELNLPKGATGYRVERVEDRKSVV